MNGVARPFVSTQACNETGEKELATVLCVDVSLRCTHKVNHTHIRYVSIIAHNDHASTFLAKANHGQGPVRSSVDQGTP